MIKLNSKGYTLVEILVASMVLMVALVAVVAIVRKGQEMIALDKHRRAARGVIEKTFENKRFLPENYHNLPDSTKTTTETTSNVILDAEDGVKGTLVVTISPKQTKIGVITVPASREIKATITWLEAGATVSEQVSISKWVANVQRYK